MSDLECRRGGFDAGVTGKRAAKLYVLNRMVGVSGWCLWVMFLVGVLETELKTSLHIGGRETGLCAWMGLFARHYLRASR